MKSLQHVPSYENITLSLDGPVASITLSREEKYNAMNIALIKDLVDAIDWTSSMSVGSQGKLHDEEGNPYLRIVVLRGAGKHFCAGADIEMMRDAGAKSPEENRADSERLDRLFNSLWAHPCFTLLIAQGVALGGGAGLVSCSDYAVATSSSKIALSEGKLGILPAVIGPYVYRRVGSATFRRLAMQASRITSEEALRIGLVDAVADDAQGAETLVEAMIAEVMSTGPQAVSQAKLLTLGFDRWSGDDASLREWTLDYTSKMRGSDEGQEGLSSFLEKRPPHWKSE
ncbi:MAG: enoyl-CoA hydratase-related protein [Candidatus Poseidoniales archaeon]